MTATASAPSRLHVPPLGRARSLRLGGKNVAGYWRRIYARRLAIADVSSVVAGTLLCHLMVFGLKGGPVRANGVVSGVFDQVEITIAVAAMWLVSLAVFGTRSRRIIGEGSVEYKRVLDAASFTFVAFLLAVFFLQLDLSRLWAVMVFVVTGAFTVLGRWVCRQWLAQRRRAGELSSRLVLVGSRKSVSATARDLLALPQHGLTPVAACITGSSKGERLTVGGHHLPLISSTSEIAAAMESMNASTVMVTGSQHLSAKKIREMSWSLDPNRHQLLLTPSITDVAGSRVHLRPVAGLPLVHVETPDHDSPRLHAKRAFDFTIAVAMLTVLAPVLAVIAVLIKREDGGPAIYTQQRVGKDGALFTIYKFRSMYMDADARRAALLAEADSGKGLFKMRDDPRVTPIGRVIRKYSLDELPQLFNVLRGDMSLVGPRPALPEEVGIYDDTERRRLVVTPGLSGLWQVSGRSDLAWEDGIRLDLYYVENWSMAADLVILWRTAKTVLFPRGAY